MLIVLLVIELVSRILFATEGTSKEQFYISVQFINFFPIVKVTISIYSFIDITSF